MKAFALAVKAEDGDDCLLGESDIKGSNGERVVGAFVPANDGNYYSELFIGFVPHPSPFEYTMSFQDWWAWLKSSIKDGDTLMSDEFPFDSEKVRVVEFDIPLEGK